MTFIIRNCYFKVENFQHFGSFSQIYNRKVFYLLVFAKVNYRESVSTEVLSSIVSAENLFKEFLNNSFLKKTKTKIKNNFFELQDFYHF